MLMFICYYLKKIVDGDLFLLWSIDKYQFYPINSLKIIQWRTNESIKMQTLQGVRE